MRARIAWALAALAGVAAVTDTSITAAYRPLLSGDTVTQHGWPLVTAAAVGSAVMGALIVSRYPRHPIGWLLILCGTPSSISLLLETYSVWVVDHDGPGSEFAGHFAAWVSALLGAPLTLTGITLIFLIAPDGHFASRRWRYAAWASLLGVSLFTLGILSVSPSSTTVAGSGHDDEDVNLASEILTSVGILLIGAALIASTVSLVRRLRRSRGETRQQLRWVAAAATALATGLVILLVVQGSNGGEQTWVSALPLFLAYFAFSICIAVAVLRHRLFDIDLVINRALVLASATALVAVGYIAVVVVIGGNAGGFWPSLVATAVVALAFQPLRTRVVRFADRLAYGPRAAPYDALADFSRRLGESPDPTTLLPAIADAAAGAVSAAGATVRLTVDDGDELTATWPPGAPRSDGEPDNLFVVADRGEELGCLTVQMPAGRVLRPHDLRLLRGLADQAAIAFRNIRLSTELSARVQELARNTAELDESRRRLIEARDRERSRIERAIARDVMPHLDPLPDQLARLARAGDPTGDPAGDPAPAHPLEPLVSAATTALEALREITRGVFPAQLARGGLGPALTSQLGRSPGHGHVMIDQTAAGRRFDWRVEAAAYFCFVEAVRDLAPPLEVALAVPDGHLLLTLTGGPASGPTLANMRDRVEAVGGSVHEHLIADRCVIQVSLLVPDRDVAGVEP